VALTNVPLDPSRTGEEAGSLEAGLRQRIVGQEDAVRQIVDLYQMYLTGLNYPGRPVGNLLFLGPTGSGKTRIVEAVAESLVGTARAVIKVDCGEFQHSHEISKLVGSPPGYLGHRETKAMLSQKTLDEYHNETNKLSFVLFDEIEKANDALWNLLLGILDKATLTLGNNERTDFSRAMIFMTSNLGAGEMAAHLAPRMGFHSLRRPEDCSSVSAEVTDKMATSATEAARKKFTPEFLNRLDKIVVFKPLGDSELRQVLDIELHRMQQHILDNSKSPFVFRLTEQAKDQLLREGTDMRYGARHLRRAIQRLVMNPLSCLLASRQIALGDMVRVDCMKSQSAMNFVKEGAGLPMHTMLKSAGGLSVAA
jgi:ATP-dependent Clp protease ATP-binding subunit ClpB